MTAQPLSTHPVRTPNGSGPVPLVADAKLQPRHLARTALIYVRQSHPSQVQRHPESARRQYALVERARALGWPADQITVIDEDQGKSAAGSAAAHERDGFGRLVSAVGLGEVGLILALEVSRLARNSAEWYRLLELAALAGVLIADEAAIYDPRLFNDRLLLGLRGTISEVELHCIQERLAGARQSKAQRGELHLRLPAGYVYGSDGRVEFDPDQAVQAALRAIFDQFARLGTASAVLRFCNDHQLLLPRQRWLAQTTPHIVWMRPSYQAIHTVLTNPFYAGAYVYGYRRQEPATLSTAVTRHRYSLDGVAVLLADHHPAYLSWEQYLANGARLRDNAGRFPHSRGAPRRGTALLQGLVVCGHCGCRMQLHYADARAAYICNHRHQLYGESICQSLSSEHVDRAVSEAFLMVIQPAEIAAALVLAEEAEHDRALVEQQWQYRLERARYEAERARRQYDQVEPENRLVARELERRWNDQLRALADLETAYQREQAQGLTPATAEERATLARLVEDLPRLWAELEALPEERKRLLRCLVEEVVLSRDGRPPAAGGTTTIRIGWRGGAWTDLRVPRPSSGDHMGTAAPVLARIRALVGQESDERIAAILNAEGATTRKGLPWTAARVQARRVYHGITRGYRDHVHQQQAHERGLLSTREASARLGVSRRTIWDWYGWGFVHAEQEAAGAPLALRLTEAEYQRLDGTLANQGAGRWTPREAERVLGIDRAGLQARLRNGELSAYRMRRGDHWSWRVSLNASSEPPSSSTTTPPLPNGLTDQVKELS
jgi:DNA invertase Pin-like site-specific DNA recombinase